MTWCPAAALSPVSVCSTPRGARRPPLCGGSCTQRALARAPTECSPAAQAPPTTTPCALVNQTAWSAPQPGVPGGACACGLEPPTMRVRVAWSVPGGACACGLERPPCVCVWLGAFPAVRVRAACAGCIWPFFLQSLRMQKSEVDLMKTKLRRLEEEKSRKDRQIEQLLDPSRVSPARPGPAAHRTARRGRRGPHRPLSRLTPLPTGPGFCPDSSGGQA